MQQAFDVGRHVPLTCQVSGNGIHHHLHRGKAGHEDAPQHGTAFALGHFLGLLRIEGMGAIADLGDRLEDTRQARTLRIPAHQRAAGGVIDLDVGDAGLAAQVLLVEPDAGCAGDALEDEGDLALVLAYRP